MTELLIATHAGRRAILRHLIHVHGLDAPDRTHISTLDTMELLVLQWLHGHTGEEREAKENCLRAGVNGLPFEKQSH